MKKAYYNEIDTYAAQWLRNLIAAGHIAPGDVDERSIEDVRPDDLVGYTQCHFFAGIGVWSYALRRAGIPDDYRVWTGSCPCQPFSAAGEGKGFADERHLWPAWFHLIGQCRPPAVLGEQVASADADPWIDLVCADMERLGYAFGAAPFPAAGIGAPHIRDRLYWVADAQGAGRRERFGEVPSTPSPVQGTAPRQGHGYAARANCATGRLGDNLGTGLAQRLGVAGVSGGTSGADPRQAAVGTGVHSGRMADDALCGRGEERPHAGGLAVGDQTQGWTAGSEHGGSDCRPGPVNGHWQSADWLLCRDGRWRPVEPGTQPLAHGAAARVGRLRAYGNAINAEQAEIFIRAVMGHA